MSRRWSLLAALTVAYGTAQRRRLRLDRGRAAVGPSVCGLLLEGFDSYTISWLAFASLSAVVTATMLVAGPAIDRERR